MYKIQKPWLDSALRFTVWGSNLLAPSWVRHRAEGQGGGHGVAFIEDCCLGLTDQRGPTGSFKVVDETEEGQSSGWGKHHRALGVLPVSNSHSGILCTGEAGKNPVKVCENPPRRMFPTTLFVMTRTLELTYAHPKRAWINELGRIHKMEEYRINQGCKYSCWWQSAIQC